MTPLNYEQNGYGQSDPTAEDRGLTPVPDADAAPDWLLADVADDPRYLCCEYAFEWHMAAGPDEAALLEQARELATQTVLRDELDRRELAEQVKDWQARAALEDEAVRQRDVARAAAQEAYNTVARLESAVESQGEVITDLREGLELVRRTLDGFGFTRGSLPDRIKAMHEELVQLRQQVAEQPAATTPPEPVRDKEAAVLSLAYLRAYLRITDAGEVQQRAYDLLCDLGRPWHQRKRFGHVVTRVQEAGIKVGLTPQEASQPLQVIQGQGGIQRKPAS